MSLRTVLQLIPATPTRAEYLTLYQALPAAGVEQLDPFLLLHHIGPVSFPPHNQGLPFGPHPHRGFATVTIVLRGEVLHHDSRGNRQVVGAGGVQWMTAARGIIHAENVPRHFQDQGGELELLQLWINLPARLKMEQPVYQGLAAEELPPQPVAEGMGQLTTIAGKWQDVAGPARPLVPVRLATLRMQPKANFSWEVPASHSALLYVVEGEVLVNGQAGGSRTPVQVASDGDQIVLQAQTAALLLLGAAEPLNEPVAQQGPFVMNNATQLMEAMRDYQMGRMGMLLESETR
ncbi:pirin family protein [Solirubrum puertoriconensis]|uniref:Nuclease PIN n=1 Tax=Solirubrum puertoriconensis TaxID=1751427 RepID=A0A9X0HMX3_SOLP1|nr:pirin family protein [Solirubrum puertoriconensis]KUG08831.1 hypothetical protein ASU33_11945 [Solirubrum puertoriconensis]